MSEVSYSALMDATFDALYAGHVRRTEVPRSLPEPVANKLIGALGPGFEQDAVRRRTRLSAELLAALPVSFFAYYAQKGAGGMEDFFDSPEWRARPFEPRELFPDSGSTVRAFVEFADREWRRLQTPWLANVFEYEAAVVRARVPLRPLSRPGALTLRPDAWVAEAGTDVPEVAAEVSRRRQEVPWNEALRLLKPRPISFSTISIPQRDSVRRIHFRGDEVYALQWAWVEEADVPERGTAAWTTVERAARAGVLV